MADDPPIRVGSIVRVTTGYPVKNTKHVGIVIQDNVWNPGGVKIQIPGSGTVECALRECYNVTEAEQKEYFKLRLQYGDD